jgi:hypothetical protein
VICTSDGVVTPVIRAFWGSCWSRSFWLSTPSCCTQLPCSVCHAALRAVPPLKSSEKSTELAGCVVALTTGQVPESPLALAARTRQ